MRLNLAQIVENLHGIQVLQGEIRDNSPMTLRYPVIYQKQEVLESDRLYIARADLLPITPVVREHCALICLGYPPLSYSRKDIELVSLSSDWSQDEIFDRVSGVFDYFDGFETRMNEAVFAERPFKEIGDILFELFQNPVQAMTSFDKFLFVAYDRNRPEFLERFRQYSLAEYVPLDERLIIQSDPAFSQIYSKRGAFYCQEPMAMYGDAVAMYNLFDQDINYTASLPRPFSAI